MYFAIINTRRKLRGIYLATISDVAREAGVSAATVSRVLNRDDSLIVTQDVRLRIFRAAQILGYVSPRQRKAAGNKSRLKIGVADWRIVRPDRPNVRLSSLSSFASMLTDSVDVSFKRLSFGIYEEVDGVIASGVFSEDEMAFLRSLTHAIIVINSDLRGYEYDQVQVDYERGLEQTAEYLLDLKRYESVGYIGGIYENGSVLIGKMRMERLKCILDKRGELDDSFFHVGEISSESGYALAKRAAEQGKLPRAILLGSDEVAEGAMEAFRELGLSLPQDLAVVFYEDIKTLESKWPNGTRLEMLPDYVWQNSLELLLDRIAQKRSQAVTVMVPSCLKAGDTA